MYYYKSAVLSHFKIGGFVSLSKSAILSRFQNRRFCPVFKIGDFVSFSKSAVLSHSKIGGFVSHPSWTTFILAKTSDLYYYESAILSHIKIGGFVSLSKSAILSRFQNRLFCPTLKSVVSSRILR